MIRAYVATTAATTRARALALCEVVGTLFMEHRPPLADL
jgi:hypothetical protein